jgi:DNA repair ATPase RecN
VVYRLRKDESVSKGLRRVVTKQLRAAAKQLAVAEPSEDAIHDARKIIKKVRAVVQLLQHELGSRRDRKRLRHAGHLLSPLREADAALATADALCDRDGKELSTETCNEIREILNQRKQRLCDAATHDQAGARAAKALDQIRRSAKDWPWKQVRFPVFSAAIQRSYKKAVRGMSRAREGNTARNFHQWRKRVKTLWYALRLVEKCAPRRRLLADLERLEARLGEDHDLLALRAQLSANRRLATTARARVRVLSEERQAALRRQALSIGARVFKATPRVFIRQLRRQWRNGHTGPPRRTRQVLALRKGPVTR